MNNGKEYFLIIKPGSMEISVIRWTEGGLLDFLYSNIECRCIEVVYAYRLQPLQLLMIVDEEGRLNGARYNILASFLYRFDRIHGAAVIGKQVVRDGEQDLGGWKTLAEAVDAKQRIERIWKEE